MYKRSELDKYERKLERYERKSWKKGRKLVKKGTKILVNWLFFYQPRDTGHGMLHIVDIIALIYLALRLTRG